MKSFPIYFVLLNTFVMTNAFSQTCPDRIEVTDRLTSVHDGWSSQLALIPHKLSALSIVDPRLVAPGEDYTMGMLLPEDDKKRENSYFWPLKIPDNYELRMVCSYHNTNVVLTKRIEQKVTECTESRDKKTGLVSAKCFIGKPRKEKS